MTDRSYGVAGLFPKLKNTGEEGGDDPPTLAISSQTMMKLGMEIPSDG